MPRSSIKPILPTEDTLERLFDFVTDRHLKSQLKFALTYFFFLINIKEKDRDLPQSYRRAINKNLIVYAASMAEAILHFTLDFLSKSGSESEKRKIGKISQETKYLDEKTITNLASDDENVELTAIGALKRVTYLGIAENTRFNDLNHCAKKIGIFNNQQFIRAQALRDKRNEIHLRGIEGRGNYGESELQKYLATMVNLIQCCKSKVQVGQLD